MKVSRLISTRCRAGFRRPFNSPTGRTAQVNPDLINFAGIATFLVEEGAAPLSVKITWVITSEDGDWKIASHHVSSQTPLL